MYRNILIATDGSELAERAARNALELAKTLGAKVTILTVTDMFPTGPYTPVPWSADIEQYEAASARSAKLILDRVSKTAQEMGIDFRSVHVADERPADGILKACRDNDCDLIVMASHGRRGLEKLLLGSQASKVVTLSPVPVLIYR